MPRVEHDREQEKRNAVISILVMGGLLTVICSTIAFYPRVEGYVQCVFLAGAGIFLFGSILAATAIARSGEYPED